MIYDANEKYLAVSQDKKEIEIYEISQLIKTKNPKMILNPKKKKYIAQLNYLI